MEILFTIIFEILAEIIAVILYELGLYTLRNIRHAQKELNPVLSMLGYFFSGLIVGFFSFLIFPRRIMQSSNIPGLSLIVTPLATGLALHTWGNYRRRNGKITTRLATFKGGALFAFGTALVRFIFFRIG